MTISNTIRTAGPYIGNDSAVAFPFYFKIFKKEDLLVVRTDLTTGVTSTLVLNSAYAVTLNGDQNANPGGTATLTVPLATGQTLVLTSQLDYLQPLDITNGGGFYPSVLNAALDRLTIFCQQLFSLARRSIKFPLSDIGMNTELPSAATRAGKVLSFDSLGRLATSIPSSGSIGDYANTLSSAVGASLIGYSNTDFGMPRTPITIEQMLDSLEYGIANIKNPKYAGGATGDGTGLRDVAAFDAAVASGCPNIYMPAGIYCTTPMRGFLLGNQSTTGQSSAPITLLADGWGTVLRAGPGFTGTVLQGWSLAGVRLGSFAVDGNGTAEHCIDTDWKAGVGPSQQNYYSFIRCYNAVGDSVWRCWDNNDARFDNCISIGTYQGQKGFDLKAGGGLFWMNNCIWDACYLSIGAQNGVLHDCWGFGIQFAGNAVNYIGISGGYLYPNTSHNACMWSESYAPFQSVGSLVVDSTQFIGGITNSCFFDLNMYSGATFNGCQFLDTNVMSLWGVNSRSDSFATVKALFKDGSMGGNCVRNTPVKFLNEYDAFMSDATRRYFPDEKYYTYATLGQGPTAFAANTWYDLTSVNQFPPGAYSFVMNWDHGGGGAPFFFTVSTSFTIPMQSQNIAATGAEVTGAISEFNIGAGTIAKFRLASDGVTTGVKLQFSVNKNLAASGTILTNFTKER